MVNKAGNEFKFRADLMSEINQEGMGQHRGHFLTVGLSIQNLRS